MLPKISVCIPTYNYGHYISFAVESILSQQFTDFELIIVDDCSKDDTEEVVSRFLPDKRVSFEKNERNLGMVANWNKCISRAKGEYIKFVFADDMLASGEALGRMAAVLDSAPSVSLVASARYLMNSQSAITGLASNFQLDFVAEGKDVIERCLKMDRNLIGEPTVVMFRRSDCTRGFDENYRHLVDLEMWFHLLERGRFAFIAAPLTSFRIHPGQKTEDNVGQLIPLEDSYRLLEQYLDKPYLRMGFITKFYLKFNVLYNFKKCARKGLVTRKEALRRILSYSSYWYFYCYYPLYKLIKPIFRIYIKVKGLQGGEAWLKGK